MRNLKYQIAAFNLLYILLLFHVLRNITPFYYLIVLLAALWALYYFNYRLIFAIPLHILIVIFCYYFLPIITTLISDINDSPIVGFLRFYTSILFIIIGAYFSSNNIKYPLRLFAVFYVMAALSLIWQAYYGPIYFLADSSERAGGARYASLVGSLTAYGGMVGIAVLSAFYALKGPIKFISLIAIIVGAILSLQKASILNVGLAFLFAFYIGLIRFNLYFLSKTFLSIVIFSTFLFIIPADVITQSTNYIFGIITSDNDLTADVGVGNSIFERFIDLPLEAINFHGGNSFFWGSGLYAGAGALGYPQIPMAHNGFIENILISGLFGVLLDIYIFLIFVYALYIIVFKIKIYDIELHFVSSCIVLWVPMYIMSGGGLFQPVSSLIFWILIFRFFRLLR